MSLGVTVHSSGVRVYDEGIEPERRQLWGHSVGKMHCRRGGGAPLFLRRRSRVRALRFRVQGWRIRV